jgi:hypothetical protein
MQHLVMIEDRREILTMSLGKILPEARQLIDPLLSGIAGSGGERI